MSLDELRTYIHEQVITKYLYENKNMNFKICILDNNYIIGLDDMCLDNKYLLKVLRLNRISYFKIFEIRYFSCIRLVSELRDNIQPAAGSIYLSPVDRSFHSKHGD